RAGSDSLTVQVEVCVHLHRTVQAIKALGVKAAVALNPATPVSALELILEDVDMVLIMSVNPGFGGQTFIPQALQKIEDLKPMIAAKNPDILIQVDGGINHETIRSVARAGADVFVAGSAIFGSSDYGKTIGEFRLLLEG
ncbi:MAG: ribulose-phosphate 3-epimerase, partial [Deltaproteobacteria bacterium]|nr:ribulose-phosphate 3-epimerase [Deltaproteobacteria bacterium]